MKRMLIDFSTNLVRIGILEGLCLKDLIIENKDNISIVSNIYVGLVKNILPSQFVFLDIGQKKNAFLQLIDKKEEHLYEVDNKGNKKLSLKNGQEIPVQVLKDQTGSKGAYVTTQLNFSSKNLVLISNCLRQNIGVSKKITDTDERNRLKKIALEYLPKGFGIIMRTECKDISQAEIKEEIKKLISIAENTLTKAKYIKATLPIVKEKHLVARAIKELYTEDIDSIIIDNQTELSNIEEILTEISESAPKKLKLHQENTLLFNSYSLETVIEKLLNKRVWLKSGAFLIIEQTEACVIIDVNTGKFAGKKTHNETILKTNLEAAKEICYQVRLRNLSGMIIIDFIDMLNQKDIDSLYELFSKELSKDRISTNIVGMTKLGLMQITRKKTREPLANILQKKCYTCMGTGSVPNESYTADRIYKSVDNILSAGYYHNIKITAGSKTLNIFKNSDLKYYEDLIKKYNAQISLCPIDDLNYSHFEIEKTV